MKKVILITCFIVAFFQLKAQDPKGQTIIGTIAPTDSLDDYFTHDDYFGLTATKIVKTLIQRDNLPTTRRKFGMKVYVQEYDTWYRLEDCLDNNCWIEDRIDTLKGGTFSTGKITVQPSVDGSTFLYDAYNYQGYQRFGVTKNGLLLAGRRMPLAVNVDALALIGDRNELLATDGMAIGKDLVVNGDTAAAFGYNLESNKYNSLLIGRGANRANRVKSRWMRSVNFGAFQTIPQIELTQDTIRLNSTVLWWNGSPFGGGSSSYNFPYTKNLDSAIYWVAEKPGFRSIHLKARSVNTDPEFGGELYSVMEVTNSYSVISNTYDGINDSDDGTSYVKTDHANGIDLSATRNGVTSSLKLDYFSGFQYTSFDSSKFVDNSLITKRYLLDRIGSGSGSISETDPVYSASAASGITSGNITTWNNLISFPGFGTSNTTAARGDHNHTGVYLTPYGNGSGLTGLSKDQVGLSAVDNTPDANKPISTATQTALNAKEPTIPTGNSGQYIAGDKTLKDFPVKTILIDVPNSTLRTAGVGTRIQLLSYMPINSIVLGATLYLDKFESTETRLSAIVGASTSYAIYTLTNIQPEAGGFNFIPNTTRYGGNILYFEVTSTNITDTQMVGKISVAYIPLGI